MDDYYSIKTSVIACLKLISAVGIEALIRLPYKYGLSDYARNGEERERERDWATMKY
jgi:hypothetical protein